MSDLMGNVMEGIDRILGSGKARTITATENCPNERCSRGYVLVDTGMRLQSQICPTCFGAGHVKVKPEVGADVALTGSHDYAS